jgi:hypothetical protein
MFSTLGGEVDTRGEPSARGSYLARFLGVTNSESILLVSAAYASGVTVAMSMAGCGSPSAAFVNSGSGIE